MYQLQVKRALVKNRFPPADGWDVTVDVDAMERAKGGNHPEGKKEAAAEAEAWLVENGVRIGAHPHFGRADVVASKDGSPTYLVEVEGDSSRQKEQAVYSALGQTILLMGAKSGCNYALAVPDDVVWERQLHKVPTRVLTLLNLELWLVGETSIRSIAGAA